MDMIAGVDEVGRGPLAGPVLAAAVILPNEHGIIGLKDSKKLSKKRREELYLIIKEKSLCIGIGQMSSSAIDDINIHQATLKAMEEALFNLPTAPKKALIDGYSLKSQIIPNEGIVGGDDRIECIQAASIIAKVTRDRIMKEYAQIFPEYGFHNNSGYGTKFHLDALNEYKATPIHRQSYKPVKNNMPSIKWLKENNRYDWMSTKLAALYLFDKGYKIIKLNNDGQLNDRVDIIIKKNNSFSLVNVKTVLDSDMIVSSLNPDQEDVERLIKSINIDKNKFLDYIPFNIDIMYVKINKNKKPGIHHLISIN